ncbi:hypothetical protein TWF730_006339 [Orbilia blumenaviensis]|uniref:Uncharacterized protein n=1 Tax=Orbilia blumenaviensis TaxID=1796055 RepID=A0AAV9VHH4_9PEZI
MITTTPLEFASDDVGVKQWERSRRKLRKSAHRGVEPEFILSLSQSLFHVKLGYWPNTATRGRGRPHAEKKRVETQQHSGWDFFLFEGFRTHLPNRLLEGKR